MSRGKNWEKKWKFFPFFRTWREKFLDFWQKKSRHVWWLSELNSNFPQEFFRVKIRTVLRFSSVIGPELFRLLAQFLCQPCRKCMVSVQRDNLGKTIWKKISSFLDNELKKIRTFGKTNIGTFVKTAFYISRGTFEVNFFRIPSKILIGFWAEVFPTSGWKFFQRSVATVLSMPTGIIWRKQVSFSKTNVLFLFLGNLAGSFWFFARKWSTWLSKQKFSLHRSILRTKIWIFFSDFGWNFFKYLDNSLGQLCHSWIVSVAGEWLGKNFLKKSFSLSFQKMRETFLDFQLKTSAWLSELNCYSPQVFFQDKDLNKFSFFCRILGKNLLDF